MKFIVIGVYGAEIVEADDIEDAVHKSYNNHCQYKHIVGVIAIPEGDDE